TCSAISCGPVAQLMPTRGTESASTMVAARDIGADEQGAGGLNGHLHQDRRFALGLRASALRAIHRSFELQRILACLDQDGLGTAGDQPRGLDRERVFESLVVDMTQGRQPRPWADRTDDEARAAIAGEFLAHLARELHRALVQIEGAVLQAELAQSDRRAAERIGLDRVRARAVVAAVDLA